jgi:hypothetical protein
VAGEERLEQFRQQKRLAAFRAMQQPKEEAVAAPVPSPMPAQEERGAFGAALDKTRLGLSDAMSTLAGDSYGRSGDPLKPDNLPLLNPFGSDRLKKALGGDVIPAAGEVGMGLMAAGAKSQFPKAADVAEEGFRYAMESAPAQAAGRGLEQAKEYLGPDTSALVGEVANIGAALLPVPKIKPKFGKNSRVKLEKSLQNRKRLETERLLEPNPNDMELKGELLEEGFWQSRRYKPGEKEANKARLVSEIDGIDPRRSNNYNTGVIKKEVKRLNTELINDLDGAPNVSVGTIENALDDAIDAARLTPNLHGDAGDVAESLSSYVDRQLLKYKSADGDITPNDLLIVRRDLDKWTTKYGPKDLYGEKGSAMSDANDAIREAINSTLAGAAPNVSVRQKLWDMSDLIEAKKLTYKRSLPGMEGGNRVSRYIENLERATGVKHPTNPQSIAITASNPTVGVGGALAALGLGAKNSAGRSLSRNRTAAMEMMAEAIRGGSSAAQKAAIIDLMNKDEEGEQ